MKGLSFQRMWQDSDVFVFDIEVASVIPLIKEKIKISSHSDKNWFFYYENNIGSAYYELGEIKKAAKAGLKDFGNKRYHEKYFKNIKNILENENIFFKEMSRIDFSKISDNQLKKYFARSCKGLINVFSYYLACQPQCVSLIEKNAQEKISETVSGGKVVDVFNLLSISTNLTKIKKEEADWINLIIKVKENNFSDDKIDKLILNHYNKYFLINTTSGHSPWTLDYFKKKFLKDSKLKLNVLKNKLKNIKDYPGRIKAEQKLAVSRYKLNNESLALCSLLSEIGHWRLEMRFVWMSAYYYNKAILNEIANRFSCDFDKIRFLSIDEISNIFKAGAINEKKIKERSKSFLYLIKNGKGIIISGERARNTLKSLVSDKERIDSRKFKGNIAMKGVVRAKALVYKWGEDIKKKLSSTKGSFILVAGQTRPQLMPLIMKSSGIITDEGGITSHAAIVSRELGIPCIIGTKIATQVLRDGDELELDADNGIIKILNKKYGKN